MTDKNINNNEDRSNNNNLYQDLEMGTESPQQPKINYYQNREENVPVSQVESQVPVDPTASAPESSEIINEIPPQRPAEVKSREELEKEMHINQAMGKGKTIGEIKTEYIYKKGGNGPAGNVLLKRKKAARAKKKAILGCLGGVIFILFIMLVFAFVFVSNAKQEESPMTKLLGVDPVSFVNGLITTVHIIFISFALIAFIFTMAGLFRAGMARKTEIDVKKSGIKMSIISGVLLFFVVISWMFAYVYLDGKRMKDNGPVIEHGIITTPEDTLDLAAPISIKFDATNMPIDTKKFQIISYHWDFGDGETSTSKITTHEFTKTGRFDVKLIITKRDKKTEEETDSEYAETVVVATQEMAALFTITPERGEAPLTVKLDASESVAPESKITKYEWDFNGDNDFSDAEGMNVEYEFEKIGRYEVELRITDDDGNFKVLKKQVIVDENLTPTAVISVVGNPSEFKMDTSYVFKADKSKPSLDDSKIVGYEWHFGDDKIIQTTKSANYTFEAEGTYEVTLKVVDEEGKEDEDTMQIIIGRDSAAPRAIITSDPHDASNTVTGQVPFTVTFDAKSSVDEDNNIVDYEWDFDGDGEADKFGETVTYEYKEEGEYSVNLKVIDADDNSGTSSMHIKAESQGLVASMIVSNNEGSVPLTVSFDATGSKYDGGQISSYEWDFGDGTPPKIYGALMNHRYSAIGTYEATLTVVGSDKKRAKTTANIVVREIPLQACFTTISADNIVPFTVAFDPSCSTGTVAQYFWTFGDGGTSTAVKPTHEFTEVGINTVQLEVTDSDGTVNTFTMDIVGTTDDQEEDTSDTSSVSESQTDIIDSGETTNTDEEVAGGESGGTGNTETETDPI